MSSLKVRSEEGDRLGARATFVGDVWPLSLRFDAEGKQHVRSGLVSCFNCTRGMELRGTLQAYGLQVKDPRLF